MLTLIFFLNKNATTTTKNNVKGFDIIENNLVIQISNTSLRYFNSNNCCNCRIAQLCLKRRKLGLTVNDQYHQQVCPQQSHCDQNHHFFNQRYLQPCLYPTIPGLDSRMSAEKRQLVAEKKSVLKQRSERQSPLVTRISTENSEPVYQEILENVDDNDHKPNKNDRYVEAVTDNPKDHQATNLQYGMITAKEVVKYRPCTQDIIVR